MFRKLLAAAMTSLVVLSFAVTVVAQTAPAVPFSGAVTRNANLRAGPGTTYAVVGSARAGTAVKIVKTSPASDWYQLENGKWIASFLVKPQVAAAGTPTKTPAATAVATKGAPAAPATATPATSRRSINDDIDAYFVLIGPILLNIGESTDDMVTLMSLPDYNEAWKAKVKEAFAGIQAGHQALIKVTPPASLRAVHTKLTDSTVLCDQGAEMAGEAIDTLDMVDIMVSSTLIEKCGLGISEAAQMLAELRQ